MANFDTQVLQLEKKLIKAQNNTLNRVKEVLIKDYVDAYIYDFYRPEFYERTYSLEKWEVSENGNQSILEPSKDFIVNPDKFQHGNNWLGVIDKDEFMKIMDDYCGASEYAYELFGFPMVSRRKHFFTDFKKWLKKNYNKIYQEECKKLGIIGKVK